MKRTLICLVLILMLPLVAGCGIANEKWSAPFGSAAAENINRPSLTLIFPDIPPTLTSLTIKLQIGKVVQWAWSVDGGGGGLGNQADPTIVPAAMGLLSPTSQPASTSSTEPSTPEPPESSGTDEPAPGPLQP